MRGTTRSRSPETLQSIERKRRRKVLSCYDCRRRKLQCDRAMPACSRCTKSGHAASCLYLDEPTDTPTRPDGEAHVADATKGMFDAHMSRPIQAAVSPRETLSRLEYQDRRIKQLEAALAQASSNQPSVPAQRMQTSRLPLSPESMAAAVELGAYVNDRESMLLRGKSFKTQFYGTTHPGGLIAHIPELNSFTKETFERFPALSRIRQDLESLEDRTVYAGSKTQITTGEGLRALLPSKEDSDRLIKLYMENWGSVYHVLHLPSFWKEYGELWTDVASARPHFVATVLLMIASAHCLASAQPWLYKANSSSAREKAITYITACEDWLRDQSQKHVNCADFQIRFLLLLARQTSVHKSKRLWTDTGLYLRFCMSAGLHRNPDLIRKKTSALDKELRRRMWAAAVEWELQAAFDRGMISSPWQLQADCPAPSNIQDDDVDEYAERIPASKSLRDFTTSSYLILTSESAVLRQTLNTTLNSIRHTLSFDDVKRYTDDLEAQLANIPGWTDTAADVPKALLSLRLRQYMLALHDRQTRQAETKVERSFSRMIIMDTATRIIDTHRALINRGCHALEVLCHDQLRAALSICHVATAVDVRAESAISTFLENQASRVMDEAIEMLTDKVLRFGREQRMLWIALAAHGYAKAKRDPEQRTAYMQEAVDKITRPYYKIMACQEDAPAGPTEAPSEKLRDRNADMPSGVPEYSPSAEGHSRQTDLLDINDPAIIDWDEIAAWTFDLYYNPAANPADLQQFGESY